MTPRPAKGIERLDENDPGKKCADKIGPDRQPVACRPDVAANPVRRAGQETGAPIGKAKGVDGWFDALGFRWHLFRRFAHGATCSGPNARASGSLKTRRRFREQSDESKPSHRKNEAGLKRPLHGSPSRTNV